jgi:hypothetical protein
MQVTLDKYPNKTKRRSDIKPENGAKKARREEKRRETRKTDATPRRTRQSVLTPKGGMSSRPKSRACTHSNREAHSAEERNRKLEDRTTTSALDRIEFDKGYYSQIWESEVEVEYKDRMQVLAHREVLVYEGSLPDLYLVFSTQVRLR